MTVVLALGKLLFHIPIRGSLLQLYLITTAFIVGNLGIGLFISTVARTQLQAMQMGFFVMMPSFLLSGFMFPREAMPVVVQWLGLALPLTYYLTVLRGVLLKGIGLVSVAGVADARGVRRGDRRIQRPAVQQAAGVGQRWLVCEN